VQQSHQQRGEQQAKGASGNDHQRTLGEQQANKACARPAHRRADRKFALSWGVAYD
jgi:hypothetical protein